MPHSRLRFAIIGNTFRTNSETELHQLIEIIEHNNAEIIIDKDFVSFLKENGSHDFDHLEIFSGSDFYADFIISMGGDGTFLTAANKVGNKEIPIIGINMGRLGFLADVSTKDISDAITDILQDRYELEERSVISIEIEGKPLTDCNYALNDIAILKKDNASMISMDVRINEEELTTYEADALIVSTPTGSTAYSLSVGGPILFPQTNVLAITPVASHSLNIRPVVVNDASEISIRVESRTHQHLIAIDGRSFDCPDNTVLKIKKAPHVVKIVRRHGQSFVKTLSEKMMWGIKYNRK